MDNLSPQDMICFALYSTAQAMQHAYKPLLTPLGLTYPQYIVLMSLWAEDDVTVGQLGRQIMLETNTLTPLLKRLEAKGFLTRRRSADDERVVRIRLTEAGREMQTAANTAAQCFFAQTELGQDQAKLLRDQILSLRKNLRETPEKPA
ncbi:Organic hydroperoxide resistance transcriptional regulator [Pelagimonas phthalicica]|uniref:Organic hydroperoxide resistance transcriptional regulator n=1 Tax=Pelagimonas phthalicica TaxID=1037362 RepID=A0A238J8M4_9RHOB|nr:MarR family transcriptional regulator [Pelagimonas phthalicica]TDS94413.1 MarR family transcriptional regulator [Pelagimonas phthalicica]SMX27060.1 Organic hydroperoxide resistance transcriptional regulator [Pelagimonas phthalicica]